MTVSVICFSLAFIGIWWACGKPHPEQKSNNSSCNSHKIQPEKVEVNLNPIDLWELKKLK